MPTNETSIIEKEVIVLESVCDHIDRMVNFSLLELLGNDPQSQILSKDTNQQKLFYILLADFLSVADRRGPIGKTSFLGGLSDVCADPQFSINRSEVELKEAVECFRNWLNEKMCIDVWMLSLGKYVSISISRFDAIKMTGTVSKHNNLRIRGVAKKLQEVASESGVSICIEEALRTLPEFYERVHNDILIYHSSYICEFLNNIRWAIHTYLKPEFNRSSYWDEARNRRLGERIAYGIRVPESIKSQDTRACYKGLMDKVRSEPYMRRFVTTDVLKRRY